MKTVQKVMLLGDIGVGKTSLARRLVFNQFEAAYKVTIGVDIYTYTLPFMLGSSRHEAEFIIWDLDGDLGQSVFHKIYIRGASSALIIGDATRPHTQKSMRALADGFAGELPGRPMCFVMNKMDLAPPANPSNPPEEFRSSPIPFLWTSAKTGANVAEAFCTLAALAMERDL